MVFLKLKETSIIVEREMGNEIEKLELPLPAVISVTANINVPSIPGMKAILAASKKKVTEKDINITEVNGQEMLSLLAPENVDRLGNIIEGDSDENIAKFISEIKNIL